MCPLRPSPSTASCGNASKNSRVRVQAALFHFAASFVFLFCFVACAHGVRGVCAACTCGLTSVVVCAAQYRNPRQEEGGQPTRLPCFPRQKQKILARMTPGLLKHIGTLSEVLDLTREQAEDLCILYYHAHLGEEDLGGRAVFPQPYRLHPTREVFGVYPGSSVAGTQPPSRPSIDTILNQWHATVLPPCWAGHAMTVISHVSRRFTSA